MRVNTWEMETADREQRTVPLALVLPLALKIQRMVEPGWWTRSCMSQSSYSHWSSNVGEHSLVSIFSSTVARYTSGDVHAVCIQYTCTLHISRHTRPTTKEVVVAMAGMIFPATPLLWHWRKIITLTYWKYMKWRLYTVTYVVFNAHMHLATTCA